MHTTKTARRLSAPRLRLTALMAMLALALGLAGAGVGISPEALHAQTVVATIPVGSSPFGAAVNETTDRVYVANYGSNTVSVIDGSTNTVIATVPVGANPFGAAVNEVTNRAYITNAGFGYASPGSVSVIDGTSNSVIATVPVGLEAEGVAVNPTTNRIYVANFASYTVSVIDGTTNSVIATVPVGTEPDGVTVNPAINRIYVANELDNAVSVIDGAANAVIASVPVGPRPAPIAANATTDRIYVGDADTDTVSVIDGAANSVLATITVGVDPRGVAVDAAADRIYVANYASNTVSVIDGNTNTVIATVPVGTNPYGAAADLATGRVYVANSGSNTVSVIGAAAPADQPISVTGTNFSATEGQPFAGQVATFADPDDKATTTDTATIDWGDGSPSSSGTVAPALTDNGSYTVSGSHTYTEEGKYTVKVTVTDGDNPNNTATGMATATVADAALTSSCATPATSTQSFNGPTATFTDANSFATKADFTAAINWGDSSTSTGTVSGGPGSGPYTVSGTHTYSTTGTFTITTTITDDGGSTTTTPGCTVLIFALAPGGTGSFVIGDKEDAVGTAVTFWSAQWSKDNPMTGGSAPNSFKGFEDSNKTPACGQTWTTDTGNSTPPPNGPLPSDMGVIVSSSISQSGSTISGNIVEIVVVHTNPGYQPDPGHPGTGTVEATVCKS